MMNRREFVTYAGAVSMRLPRLGALPAVDPEKQAATYQEALPDMLMSYLTKAVNDLATEWDGRRSEINTQAAVETRNRFVRQKTIDMVGGLPEKTPLGAVTVRTLDRGDYCVENVMFQSRPNFWVTGNLYIPTTGKGACPGIISPTGHYDWGRMAAAYQPAYLNLVKNGFVVLAYDPIGQGERRQYWNPQTGVTEVGYCITEHSMGGQLLLLMGENLTQYRIWDGMRAIDYLLTRPEVDPERIGCAGHSGGAWMTLLISALDERVSCAVVNEEGTTTEWPVHIAPYEPVGPGDVEQNLFPAALYGIDSLDVYSAIAPRSLLVMIEHYSKNFNETVEAIKARYELLGAGEKFSTVASDDPHYWTYKLRLAATDWFSRWFYGRPGPTSEPELLPERPEDLYCTPNGSILYSRQGETIWSMILKKQANLPPEPQPPSVAEEIESYRSKICTRIRTLLRYRGIDQPLNPRVVVNVPEHGYHIEKLEFLSEPGVYVPVWVFVPEKRRSSSTIIYLDGSGLQRQSLEYLDGFTPCVLPRLAQNGYCVVAADPRGVGLTTPQHAPELRYKEFSQLWDVDTFMSYLAWKMNKSLFGMRVQDLIRTVDYALSRPGTDPSGMKLIGVGRGALWALYAAALDSRIQAIVCHGGLLSYHSLTSVDRYVYGADIFIPDVLLHFDLPHVAAAVADRRLVILSPVDALEHPVDILTAQRTYRLTKEVYSKAGGGNKFQIAAVDRARDLAEQYLSLLGERGGA